MPDNPVENACAACAPMLVLHRPVRTVWGHMMMEMNDGQLIGVVFAAVSSLLGAYVLTLKVRESFAEKPDPKLTYATKTELERVRTSTELMQRDWNAARGELQARSDGAMASVHDLIRRNAEHIAVLIAQAEMFDRRLTETAQRVDRLGERMGR